ncbi:MAG: TonB, C-terminal precursor, partial [uncultured Ramlibacter sp.]
EPEDPQHPADRPGRVCCRPCGAADGSHRRPRCLRPRLPGHPAGGGAGQRPHQRAAREGPGHCPGFHGRRRRGRQGPRHLAASALGPDRAGRRLGRRPAQDRVDAGAADGDAGPAQEDAGRPAPAGPEPAHEQPGCAGTRGKAPPPGQAAGRDRAPHQRRERAAQEALHQPRHPRGGVRRLLRHAAAQDRGARHAQLPGAGGPQALWRADHDRYRQLRRQGAGHRDRGDLRQPHPGPARPEHRQGRGPVRPLLRGDAPQGRPDRGGLALQVHPRRNPRDQADQPI